MPQGLGVQLGLGAGRSATPSGAPADAYSNTLSAEYVASASEVMAVGTDSSLDLGAGSGFSVSVWAKWSFTAGSYEGMFSCGDTTNITAGREFQVTTGNGDAGQDKVGFGYGDASGSSGGGGRYNHWHYNAGSGLNDDNWHHIVCTLAVSGYGGTPLIYIDGSVASASTGSVQEPLYNQLGGGRGGVWDGLLDEVSLWDAVLSSSAVADLYNGGDGPTDLTGLSGLVSWWRFGDGETPLPSAGANAASIADSGPESNTAVQATASYQPTFRADVP